MYGQNPVRKQELDPEGKLWVQEIFATLQGEGVHAGTPSIFIRLAGCNLTCDFCDTEFESAFTDAQNFRTVENLITAVDDLVTQFPGCTNIVLTGGEPFRQNIVPLITNLLGLGLTVEIETAGTLWVHGFENVAHHCHVTVSPKTPKINSYIERAAKAYKYIVSADNCPNGECLVPTTAAGKPLPLPMYPTPIFIQPMDCSDVFKATENIAAAISLVKQTGWRLSVQTHKMLGIE